MTYLYPRFPNCTCRPPSLDDCPATWEGDKLQITSEVSSRAARESSAPASLKDQNCRLHCSTITRPTPGQEDLFRWRHHSLGFWTKDPTAGVHDQQLPERCSHLPEGKLAFDLYIEVNSHATLFTPDKHQFQTHPDITLENTQLPLECSPEILGVIMEWFTADLQCIGEIYRKLCCTSLEHQRQWLEL